MERLTAQDLSMVWPDDVGWPQDIGALAILDGTGLFDPQGHFRIDAIRMTIEARLHLVPRFRQHGGHDQPDNRCQPQQTEIKIDRFSDGLCPGRRSDTASPAAHGLDCTADLVHTADQLDDSVEPSGPIPGDLRLTRSDAAVRYRHERLRLPNRRASWWCVGRLNVRSS